jgi:hypothetical protein
LVVKSQAGEVICQEATRWKHNQRFKALRQIGGQEPLGIPDYEAERQVAKLNKWLAKQVPELDVPVRAAIVFVNERVELDAEASPAPAFYGKKIRPWLRGPGRLKSLPQATYDQLAAAMGLDTGRTDDPA